MNKDNHIFAIEGEWETKLDKELTIKSTLTLLQEVCDIDSIFRKTNTVESLLSYLDISRNASYKKYGTVVIASHGTKNDLELSSNEIITIEELGEHCKDYFENKIVHFSSCGVMENDKKIKYFKNITKAKSVSGFTKNVNFLESSVFDILLLQKLYEFKRPGDVNNHLEKNYNSLYENLGFKMI
ncbi:hypothetical protein SCB49_02529 [unidentified eubacterium SCB49]|nr:hypothetical protein SCB49_02529 [unidentified eubacterium SCB49]